MIDLGTGLKFRALCKAELRSAQVNGTAYDDLIKSLEGEAANLGLDVNKWAWSIDGPFDADARAAIDEVKAAFADWVAKGRPAPPPVGGF